MKVISSQQMRELERATIEKYKIPGLLLMENAGIAVLEEVLKSLESKQNKCVMIVCGIGNNGGDGFVIARHLTIKKIPAKLYLLGEISYVKGDARINLEIIQSMEIQYNIIKEEKDLLNLEKDLSNCGIVVDAVFGTGLDREIKGITKQVISILNNSKKEIISVDIPSGIKGDDGSICGEAVIADKTVVFQLPKIGNVSYPGIVYGGNLIIKDIGIPPKAITCLSTRINLITEKLVKDILPVRLKDTHKGTYGNALLIAGSIGMMGASVLTSKSALRSGVGLLRVAVPESLNNILQVAATEAITIPLPEGKKGNIGIGGIQKILEIIKISNVIALGPGSGQSAELDEILRNIFEKAEIPVILDADGLNVLAKKINRLDDLKSQAVLTPHPGEMARLTGKTVEEINQNRIKTASEFAEKWKVILVLKGAATIVAGPDGTVYINSTGNPGMATAGSGDVLTGIITGLTAQDIPPLRAAIAAVYIHGAAGDAAAEKFGEYGLVAGDIEREIPGIIKRLIGR